MSKFAGLVVSPGITLKDLDNPKSADLLYGEVAHLALPLLG